MDVSSLRHERRTSMKGVKSYCGIASCKLSRDHESQASRDLRVATSFLYDLASCIKKSLERVSYPGLLQHYRERERSYCFAKTAF